MYGVEPQILYSYIPTPKYDTSRRDFVESKDMHDMPCCLLSLKWWLALEDDDEDEEEQEEAEKEVEEDWKLNTFGDGTLLLPFSSPNVSIW